MAYRKTIQNKKRADSHAMGIRSSYCYVRGDYLHCSNACSKSSIRSLTSSHPQEMRIRLLMELIDGEQREENDDPACRDYEEFFRRTREECECLAEKVLRYVDRVMVWDDKIVIEIKGGVKVTVENNKD